MFRLVFFLPLVFLTRPSFCAQDGYYPVCEKPLGLTNLLGPKYLGNKPEDETAKRAIELLLRDGVKDKKAFRQEVVGNIKKNGLFVSSPYLATERGVAEKLENLCVMFSVGGASFGVLRVMEDNKDVKDTEKNQTIQAAIQVSDDKCFEEVRKRNF